MCLWFGVFFLDHSRSAFVCLYSVRKSIQGMSGVKNEILKPISSV